MENENIIEPCCSPKKQLIFKILVIVLGILIVIGLFLNAYLLLNKKETSSNSAQLIVVATPTPDPTADWKTYTNQKYGYTFKYEPNSGLKQFSCAEEPFKNGEKTFVLDLISSTFPECGVGGYAWPISVGTGKEEQECKTTESWSAISSPILIEGINGIKCIQKFIGERSLPGSDELITVSMKKGNLYYFIDLTNIDYVNTFDQILSTFRFD